MPQRIRGPRLWGGLMNDGNGTIWGTTQYGGLADSGTVFKVNIGTGALTTVVQFTDSGAVNKGAQPLAELMSDGSGFLWGTTSGGGSSGSGTIFKLDPASGALTTVVEFTKDGATNKGSRPYARLVSDGNGSLWGTTWYGGLRDAGTVFKLNTASDVLTTMVEFTGNQTSSNGSAPNAGLLDDGNGSFVGTTMLGGIVNSGTVYQVSKTTGAVTTLISFGARPYQPNCGLMDAGDGLLWGTTVHGGAADYGTIYKMNAATGARTELLSFSGNGTSNTGRSPMGKLIADGAGFVWGTTVGGGVNDNGTVFKVNVLSGVLTTVVMFSNNGATNKGASPYEGLVNDGLGSVWGTTWGGGALGLGTVFKVNAATGELTTLVEFSGSGATNKGANPYCALTADGAGFLWGTTRLGGDGNFGTLFKVNIATGELSTVLHFTNNGVSNQGREPTSALLNDGHGFLWGTTMAGGVTDYGTIYKVEVATGLLTTVINFTYSGPTNTGGYPYAGLVDDGNGSLWGATYHGGVGNYGTVFRLNVATGVLTTVVEFTGVGPQSNGGGHSGVGSLMRFSDGNLYGASSDGGQGGGGTVYRIRLGATPVTLAGMGVTPSGVKLRGTVNPNGAATSYRFEYGTAAGSLTGSTGVGALAAGTEVLPVAVALGNLLPGTTYYYRLRADNAEQLHPQYGEVLSFTTPEAQTYAQWTVAHGLTLSGAGDDGDGDGVPNLVEYGFGLDPGNGDAQQLPQPQWSGVGGGLVVSFPEPPGLTGITYGAESSESLSTGSWVTVPDSGTGGNHVFTLPVSGGKCFLRLKVSVP